MTRRITHRKAFFPRCFVALSAFAVACLSFLSAGDAPRFLLWSSSHLDGLEKTLAQKMDDTKASHEEFVTAGSPSALVFYREASGRGEVHEKIGDFGIVRKGDGAVLVGGKLVGGKSSAPGQWYGTLEGATKQKLTAGDLFYIPANTPHQWQLDPGQKLYVELIKIQPKKASKEPSRYLYWSAAQLKAKDQMLKSSVDASKSSHEDLTSSDNFTTVIVHREGSGGSEVHEHLADYHLIRSGEGFMVLGGTVVGGKSTGPGEIRGSSIAQGITQPVALGDLLYIPANMPHQFVAASGKQIDVLVIKAWAK